MTRTTERDMLKNTWSKYDCTFSTKPAKWYNIMFINIFLQYSFVIQKIQNYSNFEFLWITKLFINKRPKGHTAHLSNNSCNRSGQLYGIKYKTYEQFNKVDLV